MNSVLDPKNYRGDSIKFRYRVLVFAALACAFVNFTIGDEKKEGKLDKTKLVGTWKFKKGRESFTANPPTITMTKDGKVDFRMDYKGKELIIKGTYEWKGDDAIQVEMVGPGGSGTVTQVIKIDKLTDKEAIFVYDNPDKDKDTYDRVVEKK